MDEDGSRFERVRKAKKRVHSLTWINGERGQELVCLGICLAHECVASGGGDPIGLASPVAKASEDKSEAALQIPLSARRMR
jgi:hypothetical protein